MKVAEFRNIYDNLFRTAGYDFSSCVSDQERIPCLQRIIKIRDELKAAICLRANDYDRKQQALALAKAEERLSRYSHLIRT